MANSRIEISIGDFSIQLFNNFESADSAKLIQNISKEIKPAEQAVSLSCPLMDVNAWIDPIVYVVNRNFIVHLAHPNVEVLSCKGVERLNVWLRQLHNCVKFR